MNQSSKQQFQQHGTHWEMNTKKWQKSKDSESTSRKSTYNHIHQTCSAERETAMCAEIKNNTPLSLPSHLQKYSIKPSTFSDQTAVTFLAECGELQIFYSSWTCFGCGGTKISILTSFGPATFTASPANTPLTQRHEIKTTRLHNTTNTQLNNSGWGNRGILVPDEVYYHLAHYISLPSQHLQSR